MLGHVLTAGHGQNPARQAAIKAGIPVEKTAHDHQPGVRLRPARRRLGGAGDRARRRRRHGRGRPGEHDPLAARYLSARTASRWATAEVHRHHDHATACGTPSTATTWASPPRTSPPSGITREEQDAVRGRSQQKAEARQKAGRFKDEIVPVDDRRKKGDCHRRRRRVIRAPAPRVEALGEAAAGLHQGRHRHRRQRLGHQRRRRRARA